MFLCYTEWDITPTSRYIFFIIFNDVYQLQCSAKMNLKALQFGPFFFYALFLAKKLGEHHPHDTRYAVTVILQFFDVCELKYLTVTL